MSKTTENKREDEDLQLAENFAISSCEKVNFVEKRKFLEKTKIVKQTWSILEIFQKIKEKKLILSPDYQRNSIWKIDKKTAFVESLYMGIMIPPIYVVEIKGEDILSENIYEIVDGKQRLSTILGFINNEFKLNSKSLEYFQDYFENKYFDAIKEEYTEMTTEMLSSVLDIYVITSNSPEFTKYDIFSRLNKGSEKLKVNEIRRAIYRSKTLQIVSNFITERTTNGIKDEGYHEIFTKNDIERYEDYGRFYRSISYYLKTNIESAVVENYNSRPREMINNVLQGLQNKNILLCENDLKIILLKTIELKKYFMQLKSPDYFIDICIPYVVKYWDKLEPKLNEIKNDKIILDSLKESPATTNKLTIRVERIKEILFKEN